MAYLEGRVAQTKTCEVVSLQLRGVSIQKRQATLHHLSPGSRVILYRERNNPHDPGAVQVTTLGGRDIGYIPKESTDLVVFEQSFGEIGSLGAAKIETGAALLGANVIFQPHLPPLAVELLPSSVVRSGASHVLPLLSPRDRALITDWSLERCACFSYRERCPTVRVTF